MAAATRFILSASPIRVVFWFQVEVRVRLVWRILVPVADYHPSGFRPNQVSPSQLDPAISLQKASIIHNSVSASVASFSFFRRRILLSGVETTDEHG